MTDCCFIIDGMRKIEILGFLASLDRSFIKLAARFFDVRPVIPNPI
jgi:hypothetical protein